MQRLGCPAGPVAIPSLLADALRAVKTAAPTAPARDHLGRLLRGWRNPETREEVAAKFWLRCAPRRDGQCWEWTGPLDSKGYGHSWLDQRNAKAHRIAYILTNGQIPKGLHVLHRCDNPRCCNPGHLFLGTHQENMQDMAAKKRNKFSFRLGEAHHGAKLTAANVAAIRASSLPPQILAEKFSVTRGHINKLRRGMLWK